LDTEKHKEYIIHQVLQFGDISDFVWVKNLYSRDEIAEVFISKPRSTYSRDSFAFIKNYLLKIPQKLDERNYVRSAL